MSPAKFQVLHDELDDVTPSPDATPASVASANTARAIPEDFPSHNSTEPDEDELDWGSTVSVGDGLERIAPKKSEVFRFAPIPTLKPKRKMVHYIALAGQKKDRPYLCHGTPACPACRAGSPKKPAIVALIVQYSAADIKTGALDNTIAPRYRIGYLSMSAFAYNLLAEAPGRMIAALGHPVGIRLPPQLLVRCRHPAGNTIAFQV